MYYFREEFELEKGAQMFKSFPDVLHIKDLQRALGIGKSAAYSLVETGQIDSFRIGRVYKIKKAALIHYVNNQSC